MHETHRRRNFAALIGDFALFSIGFAFYDPFVLALLCRVSAVGIRWRQFVVVFQFILGRYGD